MIAKISGGADIMQLICLSIYWSEKCWICKRFCKSEGLNYSEHTRGEHGRLILLANNFETFIKVTQKSETDNKIFLKEKLQTRNYKSTCYQRIYWWCWLFLYGN